MEYEMRRKLALLLTMAIFAALVVPSANAAQFVRFWLDTEQPQSTVRVEAEVLRLQNGQFTVMKDNGEPLIGQVDLQFGSDHPRMFVGEFDLLHIFVVIVYTANEAHFTTKAIMCMPPNRPFEWEPQGPKWVKRSVSKFSRDGRDGRETQPDIVDMLKKLKLLPEERDFDYWDYRPHVAWDSDAHGNELQSVLRDFYVTSKPVQLKLKKTRPKGYEIPSTLLPSSIRTRVAANMGFDVRFDDYAVARDDTREAVRYEINVYRYKNFLGSAALSDLIFDSDVGRWKKVMSVTMPGVEGQQEQACVLPAGTLEQGKAHSVAIRVLRESYGDTPSAEAHRKFPALPNHADPEPESPGENPQPSDFSGAPLELMGDIIVIPEGDK